MPDLPLMAEAGTPVVFVHGLWLHADSWTAWIDRFTAEGYAPVAPGWPGDSATIEELWDNAQFIRQTEAGQRETHPGSPGE